MHWCNVCGGQLTKKLYESVGQLSLTSITTTVECPTKVFFCGECGHVQTPEMLNELAYYDKSYDFLTNSDDEDQVYAVEDGKVVYRTQHQVRTLCENLEITSDKRILDYGCGKSPTMRELTRQNPKVRPHLFDVSKMYIPFWQKFIEDGHWATYQLPSEWNSSFDIVTSFFSLEHITRLDDAMQKINKLLVEGGVLYAIIPNTQTNPADLIVVDHPNHFTQRSLHRMLICNGFTVKEIDETSHRGAYVVIAEKKSSALSPQKSLDSLETTLIELGAFWSSAAKRVREFEDTLPAGTSAAIYGAGIYGLFLASNLQSLNNIRCFLDQNKFLQGSSLMDCPIIAPNELPKDVNAIYAALNPRYSKNIIENVTAFQNKDMLYFFM